MPEPPAVLEDDARITAEGIRASIERHDWNGAWNHIADQILFGGNLATLQLNQNQAITFWETLGGPELLERANRDPRLAQPSNACTVMMMLLSRMSLPADRESFFNQIGITEFVARHRDNLVRAAFRHQLDYDGDLVTQLPLTFPGHWIERFPQLTNTAALKRNALALRIGEYSIANGARAVDLFNLVDVNRARALETSFGMISRATASALRRGVFSVSYAGEVARGEGLIREWFSLIASVVSFRPIEDTDTPLLSPRDETPFDQIVNDDRVSPDQYNSLGRLLALSIIDGFPLGFNLHAVFFKKLLGQPIVLDDLRGLLGDNTVGNIQYVMDATTNEELQAIGAPLMESGADEEVSLENRHVQFASMINNVCTNKSPEKFQAIADGFIGVIPRELLTGLTPDDLRSFIRGNEDIDIADFRRHYNVGHGYAMDSPQIQWLFTVLGEYDQPMRSKFLRFVTGRSILPTGGFGALGTRILIDRRDRTNENHQVVLPTSHTCFHSIDLPQYESIEELRRMLTAALEFDAGGAMLG
jgi:hypothetical protein